MKSYQQKLTISFLIIFILFSIGIVIVEYYRASKYRIEALENRLDSYATIINQYLKRHSQQNSVDSLAPILPDDLRISLISDDGAVEYDNAFTNPAQLENHAQRPELIAARQSGKGLNIRISASNCQEYIYYAKYTGNRLIRVALPYSRDIQRFLKPDNGFFYFMLIMFSIWFVFISHISSRFGKSVRQLRDFSLLVENNPSQIQRPIFPDDELGEISTKIVSAYASLKQNEKTLKLEREKLLQHIQSSAEGICFFKPNKAVAFYNGLFLQYLNILSKDTFTPLPDILNEKDFQPIADFIDAERDENYFETRISKQGKEFLVRVNVFEDHSFEIILNDITHHEKTRKLKQEMTGNIAHELRTPVTSIRGFLETVLDNDLDMSKEREFLQKAYSQTKTLSELISDMSLLTKIEENSNSLKLKNVNIYIVINKVMYDLEKELKTKHITIEQDVATDFSIKANEGLIYSIFRNLTDNAIRYAGENIRIIIKKYDEKDGYAYFSFADTGKGIEDETHLNRIFERFYRINEGRTRDTGGSGLGLSIVKNAIIFHKGTITVKNRKEGGLEFLFILSINRDN
ncbi:MAG: HAMP domain-containing histidine kinase [Prevotellaceae bacterium]|jgi:signal transduction histidine kinase|nr:HAMP domain-containing histidine kinase [Prevotellaceae bacterium]